MPYDTTRTHPAKHAGKAPEARAGQHSFVTDLCEAEAVQETITYLTNNSERMRYATFRAAGLQVGSGSIENGCKQVIGARQKLRRDALEPTGGAG